MAFRAVRYRSADGLSLYARDYRSPGDGVTVLCLPGLTRNGKDFEFLAQRLAAGRRVVCPDFRGRGLSQYGDGASYRADVEMADTLILMDHLGIERAAIIGTSRGGIVALFLAHQAKARLAGIAFNDVGPRLEPAGLLRIRNYLTPAPGFSSWEEAVAALRASSRGFEGLSDADWLAFARRLFRDEDGILVVDHDPGLLRNFPDRETIESGKVPELWGFFDHVAPLPALVLRGANSDLLSALTVSEMQRRHPGLAAVTVAGRGHVPFLDEAESLAAIDRWLAEIDGVAPSSG